MTLHGGELAVVMSGGGARAAYQVGVLRSIARLRPQLAAPILTGVSAGAINAAFLAANEGDFGAKANDLAQLWRALTPEQVFEVSARSLTRSVLRWGTRLMLGRASKNIRTRGMVDTEPLRVFLRRLLQAENDDIPGIARNLERGSLRAVAITTSSYSTGQSITWVQGRAIPAWERAHRKSALCTLNVDHVMASAALPLFFPAVAIGEHWYGDGGMRLTAPLSPAIHLGARRILAISTRYGRTRAEADRPSIDAYPPPAQVIGNLFNAIFLDLFDADALQLRRINKLIAALPEDGREGLQPVEILVMRPSQDLGRLANEYEAQLPHAFRFLTRGLGTQQTRSNDLLSLVMFQPDYLEALISLGEKDAEARAAEIDAFLVESA